MARPTSGKDPLTFQKFGVILGVHPSTNAGLPVELWSSTQTASTASSLWAQRTLAPSTQPSYRYTFERAPSTTLHYFKARHPASPGYSAGSFTPTVSARPVELPRAHPPEVPLLNNSGNLESPVSDIWVTSAKTVKVGTQQTTSTKEKMIVFPAPSLLPYRSTGFWYLGAIAPGALGITTAHTMSTQFYRVPVILPIGTQITGIKLRSFKGKTAAVVAVTLAEYSSNGSNTDIVTFGHPATTGWVTTTSAVSRTIAAFNYDLRITMSASTGGGSVQFLRADVVYHTGSLDETY